MHKLLRFDYFKRGLGHGLEDCYKHVEGYPQNVSIRNMSVIIEKSEVMPESELNQEPPCSNKSKFFTQQLGLHNLSWLHSAAPGFALDGNKISIIHDPNVFYSKLLEKCQTAKRRITLASLYLGTGPLEEKLVSAIGDSLQLHGKNLKVKVLLDFTRGSRGTKNSRHMLLPLLNKHETSCQVSLYHTPALRGLLRNVQRYNELVGLQHMKLCIIDDSVIISGANLSNDYFTNRQDRYLVIEDCRRLADFYDDLVSRVSEFSLQLDKSNQVNLHSSWKCHPFLGNRNEFETEAQKRVMTLFEGAQQETNVESDGDTWVFPLVEMGQLGIKHDSVVTTKLLETAEPGSKIHLATGYFNLTHDYIDSIINRSKASYSILMAHPNANGFLGAKGPAGGVPFGYTRIANFFFSDVRSANQGDRITMAEYERPGWTYHAKGLWYTLPGQSLPSLTLIGSPNFGGRSVNRDLETQLAIVTGNPRLQKDLLEEQERLYRLGTTFTDETAKLPERIPPLWTRCVVGLFRNFF